MITTGKRYTPKEIERYIDAVNPDEIKRVAQRYLWDKDVSLRFCSGLLRGRKRERERETRWRLGTDTDH
jgi:predicted Zn-dependent peptidase